MSAKNNRSVPIAYHLVAHIEYPHPALEKPLEYQRLWRRLTEAFPEVVALVLMPDHLHLIIPSKENDPAELQSILRAVLHGGRWGSPPAPQPIPNISHLRRHVRYVHLNPCRDELCDDPLRWPWSTHRDYVGAAAFPASDEPKRMNLAQRRAFHKYVSSDPSVHPMGTAAPMAPQMPALIDLSVVERAAEVVCRAPTGAFSKKGRLRARLMAILAGPLGVPAAVVARHFGVHPTSVRPEVCSGFNDPILRPLIMTLTDERLLPSLLSRDSLENRNLH